MSNPIVEQARKSTRASASSPGQCSFCEKKGLMILPLRHSAFCSDSPGLLAKISDVGLGESFALEHAKLTARMLRKGYLYVLLDRQGELRWQAYHVTDDARLYEFPPIYPPSRSLAFSCARDANNASTSMVSIEDPQEVERSFWLFTPDPLSEAKLDEYRDGASAMVAEEKMQTFSPAGWIKGNHEQQFCLESQALPQWIPEFGALGITPEKPAADAILAAPNNLSTLSYSMVMALNEQAYPALCPSLAPDASVLMGAGKRLEAIRDKLHADGGAVFVLRDAIGVTQELNAWRNAAMEGVEPWLAEVHEGASNDWRVQSAQRLKDVQDGIREHAIRRADEQVDAWATDSHTEDNLQGVFPDTNKAARDEYIRRESDRRFMYLSDLEKIPPEMELRKEALKRYPDTGAEAREAMRSDGKRINRQGREAQIEASKKRAGEDTLKLFDQIDLAEVDDILKQFEARIAECEAKADARAESHLQLLRSQYLLNALYAYDPDHLRQGWSFSIQAALCTLGMEACVPGQTLLTQWWEDTQIAEGNLFWRGYGLNQKQLLEDTRAGLTQSKSIFESLTVKDSVAAVVKEIKRANDILKSFEKANKVLADGEKLAPMDWLARTQVGVLMGWYAQMAKGVFTYAAPNRADKAMAHVLVTAMNWRLGQFAPQLQLEELADAKTPKSLNTARAQLQVRVRRSVQMELESGKIGNFYALRLGVITGLYEAFQLYYKAQAMPDGNKEKAEFAAAALATVSASLGLMQTGAEWTVTRYGVESATGRIASAWGAGLKLYGGLLGAVGGVIGAVIDGFAAWGEFGKGRKALGSAYFLRVFVSGWITSLSLRVAVAGSGPYIELLMKRVGDPLLIKLLARFKLYAAGLAEDTILLAMRTALARLVWATLVISGIVMLLEPEAIEKWCEKSVFRVDKTNKQFKTENDELIELEMAFKKMVES